MTDVYVYNPTRRIVHKIVDGRSFEQCNVDDIADPRTLDESELQTLIAEGRAHLCQRCFKEEQMAHPTMGRPLPGQGIVDSIVTPPEPKLTKSQREAQARVGTPVIDHLTPRRGDGLTRQVNTRPGGLGEIPPALVQVNMDAGPRFEGGGQDAQPHLPEKVKGTPEATASADAGDPSFNPMSAARRDPNANVDLDPDPDPVQRKDR